MSDEIKKEEEWKENRVYIGRQEGTDGIYFAWTDVLPDGSLDDKTFWMIEEALQPILSIMRKTNYSNRRAIAFLVMQYIMQGVSF